MSAATRSCKAGFLWRSEAYQRPQPVPPSSSSWSPLPRPPLLPVPPLALPDDGLLGFLEPVNSGSETLPSVVIPTKTPPEAMRLLRINSRRGIVICNSELGSCSLGIHSLSYLTPVRRDQSHFYQPD